MLEVKNLTKVYKTKGGAETRALDGVSLRFEERGMIFLLGKSGSGKSTLLNLCGGLDTPDSGEIIIKGRSSKDFSQADFDSYRNTFVGFVFQEYNILNEFTVEDNIALALELQGKNKDKARVHEILEQVEMSEFAKRKPNTLSG
ncbi:MAG TPA: ATP-binding cassette domain-containing protein, partial [Candidatus Borkfalkia excrementipullorum]|nr:ATP-binding cassette domain-containing protein [Candidatus Borkfalkia excrementipullorum]